MLLAEGWTEGPGRTLLSHNASSLALIRANSAHEQIHVGLAEIRSGGSEELGGGC